MTRCETCLVALQVADREDNNCPDCKDYKDYMWFATDGFGSKMGRFYDEMDAREYAMKYGYTVGWESVEVISPAVKLVTKHVEDNNA